jgi:hypothetical protein
VGQSYGNGVYFIIQFFLPLLYFIKPFIVKDKKRRDGRDNRITEEGVDRKLLSFA